MADNIDNVRAAMEAFDRRDPDAFGVYLHPDVVIVPVRSAIEGTVFRGPSAAADYCAAVEESWETLHRDIEEMRDGPDWVLASGRIRGSGRGSGAALDLKAGWVARLRDGSSASSKPTRTGPLRSALSASRIERRLRSCFRPGSARA